MISPLLPGASSARDTTLSPAQTARLEREQGRVLIEVSSTPSRLPELASGERLAATVSERLSDGKLAAQIKGETFLLNMPAGSQAQAGNVLNLRVASLQPLAFALVDLQQEVPAALQDALRLATSQEETPLATLSQPAGKTAGFQVGEWVHARVAERLADGSAVVLAKNAAFTLQAPPGSKALNADPLLLRVRATDPVVSFVQVALDQDPEMAKSAPVSLSDATRYLNILLQAANQPGGRPSATAAALAAAYDTDAKVTSSGKALLANPEQPGSEHSASLQQTVEKSGLFYESHQKAWIDGRLSLDELRQEPQAKLGDAAKAQGAMGQLVQRQLETLEQRQFVYNGMAWPGQQVQWQIQADDTQERDASGAEEMRAWHTQLNLQLPALGGVAARLRMVGNQVQLVFATDSDAAGTLIESHRLQLAGAMEAAGLALASLQVKHETEST
ncbi:flagellar hook-length control protein FliK [Vogesella oryzae]|uniref:flagellar hook-length control protein FliK n=1 Tax=Vogesella oryzae TaxID=1735285 RepID=UPI001581B842|nr:flagellar hook-length control protein FliK [Vogesella oryzae]